MEPTPPRLEAVHPVLASRDIAASLDFFARLGFRETFRDDPARPRYAAIVRDGVELHLQWHDAQEGGGDRPNYRFSLRDVDGLFAEFQSRGLAAGGTNPHSPWARPGDTPWGTREFHVRDPDGNGLQFYRTLEP